MSDAGGAIGVFDSGVGGLTVLRALRAALPTEDFIYLGDTARLPYGTKSADTVIRYSLQCAAALVARNIRCLVVACNTASASALSVLRLRYPQMPVIGVIEPGAAAAVTASVSQHIAVIGTEGTIQGGAYQAAIRRLNGDARVASVACSLFVAMAEEGWVDGPIAIAVAERYLGALFGYAALMGAAHRVHDGEPYGEPYDDLYGVPDTLVLGCTHFPALLGAIRAVLPAQVVVVDSAATTAAAVFRQVPAIKAGRGRGSVSWLATDGAARFAKVGSRFLGEELRAEDVSIIDL